MVCVIRDVTCSGRRGNGLRARVPAARSPPALAGRYIYFYPVAEEEQKLVLKIFTSMTVKIFSTNLILGNKS